MKIGILIVPIILISLGSCNLQSTKGSEYRAGNVDTMRIDISYLSGLDTLVHNLKLHFREGTLIVFTNDGKEVFEVRDSLVDGKYQLYFGRYLSTVGEYKRGLRQGKWVYYDNIGGISKISKFKDGELDDSTITFEHHKPYDIFVYNKGQLINYYANDKTIDEFNKTHFSNGNGILLKRFDVDKLMEINCYSGSKREGIYYLVSLNSDTLIKGNYHENYRSGRWDYDLNKLFYNKYFLADRLDSFLNTLPSHDRSLLTGFWNKDTLSGSWILYDQFHHRYMDIHVNRYGPVDAIKFKGFREYPN